MKRTLLTSVCVVVVMVTLACNARGGSSLYFSSNRDGNWEIYSTVVKSGEVVNITNTAENEINPVLSPDRKWIAFLIGRDGRSIDVLSLESRDSPERFAISKGAGRFWSPVWSPDSRQIAFAAKKSGEEAAYVQITDLELHEIGVLEYPVPTHAHSFPANQWRPSRVNADDPYRVLPYVVHDRYI